METLQRVLLSENKAKIAAAEQAAMNNAKRLNSISQIFEFETEEEFRTRTENLDRMVRSAMMRRPTFKSLSETVEFSAMKVPEDIAQARQTIEELLKTENLFAYISHDGKQWIEDIDKLEAFGESQRVYAVGKNQIERYEAANNLCKFLNDHKLGFGTYEKGSFHNILIEWSLQSNSWVPNIRWIVS